MIKTNNLEKKYNNQIIIQNVNLDINEGKFYVFTGINGSGKSTILKILSKVIFKSLGDIELSGTISYLPDKYSLPGLMTVDNYLKNIINLYSLNLNSSDILREYDIPNKKIKALSKGNLQKLGLVQALINPTDIYIFDEPLDGLDDFAKKLFKEKIKEKLKDNKTVIMSLHAKTLFNDLHPIIYEVKEGRINEKKKRLQA